MPSAADLSALSAAQAWEHFGADEETAMAALRAAMGDSYAATPDDATLTAALVEAVDYLEAATGRFFVARSGTLSVDGTGTTRLFLPYPVVSTGQDAAGGVSEILIGDDTTAVDEDAYEVNDGIGLPGRDPRDHPFIDLILPSSGTSFVSRPPGFGGARVWPLGTRNVHVAALWGYVDESGATPTLARKALAGLAIRALAAWDDPDAQADLHQGAITTETTRDRSISYSSGASGGGITTDRTLDMLIARLRAPARVRVQVPPRRRVNDVRNSLIRPPRWG